MNKPNYRKEVVPGYDLTGKCGDCGGELLVWFADLKWVFNWGKKVIKTTKKINAFVDTAGESLRYWKGTAGALKSWWDGTEDYIEVPLLICTDCGVEYARCPHCLTLNHLGYNADSQYGLTTQCLKCSKQIRPRYSQAVGRDEAVAYRRVKKR